MEFDQILFKRVFNFLIKKRKQEYGDSENRIRLEEVKPRLLIIARAVSGKSVEIVGSEREGGWKDETYFLPREAAFFPSLRKNLDFYLFRTLYLCVQSSLGLNWSAASEKEIGESQEMAIKTSKDVLTGLFKEFPGLEEVHSDLKVGLSSFLGPDKEPDHSWLYGRWMSNSPDYENGQKLENIGTETFKGNNVEAETEIKAKHADEVQVVTVDKKSQENYMLTHNFEKVETVDKFNGIWRDFDGDDTLKDDEQALGDLDLKHLVRVDDPVHSVYQAEMLENINVSESSEVESSEYSLLYPEWDFRSASYKRDHCRLYPKKILETDRDYHANTLKHNRQVFNRLRKVFALLNNDLELVKRQFSGDHIDIDAATERYADLYAKRTPEERVYLTRRKRNKDLSLIFLLDLSLSSDAYAHGNRIIDVEKQVSILFGEVMNEYGIDFQIDGFFSKTRNMACYRTLKAFNDPWEKARFNIGAVQPEGYTRIGPAIRHAKEILKKRPCKKKWLILLSDGKPNDYDRYEGKYGIKDIQQALRELNAEGMNSYAVAIEEQAKYYLPQMFGHNHYNILSSPMEMINSLTQLYRRIESNH